LNDCNVQLLYIAGVASIPLRSLAGELSHSWHELGGLLSSRRLQASLHTGAASLLTPTKLRALDVLAEGNVRVGELADRVGVDDTTATRLIDRLVAAGLVERRDLPGDRRVSVVGLTADGVELVGQVTARRQRFFGDVLAALEPDERKELVRLTAKAADALRTRSEELMAR
jgi:DNA-binding MarR family transcriptional regulator